MAASREQNLARTFSINNILQEEKRPQTSKEATSAGRAQGFREISPQNEAGSPELHEIAPQNCVIAEEAPQTSFWGPGFASRETPNTGLKNSNFGCVVHCLLRVP